MADGVNYMNPSFVEEGVRLVSDTRFGCCGAKLRHRVYVASGNPGNDEHDVSHSLVKKWILAGEPDDAVFHYGRFHRITVR